MINKTNNINDVLEVMEDNEWKTKHWFLEAKSIYRTPNFEEAFFGYLFKLNDFPVKREYVLDFYPIDYAVPEAKLAIEIDSPCCRGRGGRNSKKKKAITKENYLRLLGWTVHRINWWKRPFDLNREHTQKEIDKILLVLETIYDEKQ